MYKYPGNTIFTAAMSAIPYDEGVEAALRFESKYGETVDLTVRHGNKLWLPRNCVEWRGPDHRTSYPDSFPATSCKLPPRDEEQASCIVQSLNLLQNDISHVVEAPTGFGKTYIGSAVAMAMRQPTIIVVTKQDLMDQWYSTLVNLIGIDPKLIGKAQADKLDYKGKQFVLTMVQSLIRPGKYDDAFFSYFGLAIFDETHRMAADCFSRACHLLPAKYRLGLSATPKRVDGKTPVVTAHIGEVLVRGTVVPMKPKVLVKKTGWKIPGWMTKVEPGRMMPVYKAMATSPLRNAEIVKFVKEAYEKDRTVVVMGDTLDHLSKLQLLCGAAGIPGEDMGTYTGEISGNKELLKFNANKRVIFATYGMTSEGTDYPHWDTLVLVTPRANVKQPVGRILRTNPGKKTPVVLDLVDDGSIFHAFAYKRQTTYYSLGAQVVKL